MPDARDAEDSRLLDANDHTTLLATYYPVILERCKVLVRGRDWIDFAHAVVDRLLSELSRGKRYRVPFRVVVHKVIEWKVKEHYTGAPAELELADWDATGDDLIEEFERRYYLEGLFATLPARDGEVMRMRYLDLLEPPQIAEVLEISANAVHQALWRGHQALRETLRCIADVSRLFDEYAVRYRRGERPDAREYLERAGKDDGELAALIDAFVARAPAPAPDEDTVALMQAWAAGEPPLLALRVRRGQRREAVVEALLGALELPAAKRERVAGYYHELETGLLDPARVSRRAAKRALERASPFSTT